MNELRLFKNELFSVRTVEIDNEPFFVAKDVAQTLGYQNTNEAIKMHCKKANDFRSREMLPTATPMKIIPESDVYRLIMRSKLPSAERFQDWVVEEVIPSIRKHETYMTDNIIEKALTNPDFLIQIATQLKEEREKRIEAEKTKAYISDKKTAQAMATASNAVKKVKKLEEKLGVCESFATILAVETKLGQKFDYIPLRRHCLENELEIKKVIDSRYGTVNSYPKEAWAFVYGVDIKEIYE